MKIIYNRFFTGKFPILCVRKFDSVFTDYPYNTFVSKDFAFRKLDDNEIILITKLAQDDDYSEINWLHKEEIRILGAMSLTRDSLGWYTFYSNFYPIYVEQESIASFDLSTINNFNEIYLGVSDEITPAVKIDMPMNHSPNTTFYDPNILLDLIDLNNDTLIKSLGYWLKAGILSKHYYFCEEATIHLFFALEGILKLFHSELQEKNPTVRIVDVAEFLVAEFNVHEGYKDYILNCYDLRVEYVHPFNNSWKNELIGEDLYETFNILKDLFYIYLTRRDSLSMDY